MANLRSADQEQLQKLLLGRLPSADIERLAIEYADDSRLAELAESLTDQNDALLQLLHNHETATVDPEGERLVERLIQQLKPALTVAPKDDTAAMRLAEVSTEPSLSALAKPPQQMPERLEYYRPIKILGQGGMGTVYLAEDTRLGREVAIKTLRPELAINPQAKERFLREARTAAKLEHDNVIPIYSVGEADGTPFLAMPLLKGEPLDALIRRTTAPLSIATVVRMSREIASGLAAAHTRGLIHRDIKPANIWLESPTGRVKILDFGLAKAADAGSDADSETNLTASGAIVGTPSYMAPEQASGHPVDGRADLFSLGCVMYELLTGKRPFSGPNTMAILMSLANHTPPAPQQLRAECPAALSKLVMQLLEKAPAKRPASAEAVIQALDELETKPAATSVQLSSPLPVADASPETSTPRGSTRPVANVAPLEASDSIDTPPPTTILPVRQPAVPKRRMLVALASVLTLLLAAVIYRIQTDQGTLVVTIEDPAVQAILERDGLVIRDKNSDRIWTIKSTESKSLPSGEYHLKANQQLLVTDESGVELTTDTFTLKRKGEVRVRVTLDQNAKFAGKDGDANKAIVVPGWHGWPADAPKPAIAPFNADEARQHQEAWARYLTVPVEYTNSIGMKFRLIPPGEFLMGSTPEELERLLKHVSAEDTQWQALKSEAPRHRVILTKPFYLGATEITQSQYEKVIGANPSRFARTGTDRKDAEKVDGLDTSPHPVEGANWNDAAEFCARLSEKEQLQPFYFRSGQRVTMLEGTGYRLPAEAEWEFACRAGTTAPYWYDESAGGLAQVAWNSQNSGGRTHAVGELKANPFGLFDVIGNVWEWVQDGWNPSYYEQFLETPAIDPTGAQPANSPRVVRGTSINGNFNFAYRSATRYPFNPTHQGVDVGFRVSLPVDGVRQALKVTGPRAANASEKLPTTFTNSLGMEFVKVPKGTGWLGGGGGKPGEQKVVFTDDFYLGKYEVTQEEWEKVTGLNPSYFSRNGKGKDAVKEISDADLKRLPVESVSWDDCQLFIEQLNKQAKETGWVYRLPSEAEWEYACRGGPVDKLDSAFDYYFEKPMNTLFPEKANYGHDNGLRRTCKVASYPPNSLGLHDMHGDVWEWCDGVTINEHSSVCRITRGGCWAAGGNSRWHATDRQLIGTTFRDNGHGLRVARVRVGTKSDKDPDRRAAEYVLSIGGTVEIDGSDYVFKKLSDLPNEGFTLAKVTIPNQADATDAGLKSLKNCLHLSQLFLHSEAVTDSGLQDLKDSKHLKSLYLDGVTKLTDIGFGYFKNCRDIERLNLNNSLAGCCKREIFPTWNDKFLSGCCCSWMVRLFSLLV